MNTSKEILDIRHIISKPVVATTSDNIGPVIIEKDFEEKIGPINMIQLFSTKNRLNKPYTVSLAKRKIITSIVEDLDYFPTITGAETWNVSDMLYVLKHNKLATFVFENTEDIFDKIFELNNILMGYKYFSSVYKAPTTTQVKEASFATISLFSPEVGFNIFNKKALNGLCLSICIHDKISSTIKQRPVVIESFNIIASEYIDNIFYVDGVQLLKEEVFKPIKIGHCLRKEAVSTSAMYLDMEDHLTHPSTLKFGEPLKTPVPSVREESGTSYSNYTNRHKTLKGKTKNSKFVPYEDISYKTVETTLMSKKAFCPEREVLPIESEISEVLYEQGQPIKRYSLRCEDGEALGILKTEKKKATTDKTHKVELKQWRFK